MYSEDRFVKTVRHAALVADLLTERVGHAGRCSGQF
jgi:hypothetical protein